MKSTSNQNDNVIKSNLSKSDGDSLIKASFLDILKWDQKELESIIFQLDFDKTEEQKPHRFVQIKFKEYKKNDEQKYMFQIIDVTDYVNFMEIKAKEKFT